MRAPACHPFWVSQQRRRPSPRMGRGARLTGGEGAGRRLLTLEGEGLRASSALVRAALFNIVGEQVPGAEVLDLFSGIGSLGLEALSRGAGRVTFVELQRRRAELIRANLQALGWEGRAEILTADVRTFLRSRPETVLRARLAILDPPFLETGPEDGLQALRLLGERAQASPQWEPTVVLERHRRLQVPDRVGALNCVRTAAYGTSVLSFYRRLP